MIPYPQIIRSERSRYLYEQLAVVIDDVSDINLSASFIRNAEIDFGSIPVSEKIFTITDPDITLNSNVIAKMSYAVPTGKDLDELEFDTFSFICKAGSGQFTLYAKSLEGYVADKFIINYLFDKS